MALVAAQCTQCGANLEVDPMQEIMVCPACDTLFITEKAINNYNTNIHIGNIHTETVVLNGNTLVDNKVRAGETFLKMADFQSAENVFDKLSKEYPYDYRGWWGIIQAKTQNFTGYLSNYSDWNVVNNLYKKAKIVADSDSLSKISIVLWKLVQFKD